MSHKLMAVTGCALAAVLATSGLASATEGALSATPNSGDNAWMLTSSALVLMMTAPGLAMFYSGLVRKKNVLGVMMQCVFLMAMNTIVWALWGYSLSFGGSFGEAPAPWVGNLDHIFMRGVQPTWVEKKPEEFKDKNDNKKYDVGEEFIDYNGNGQWDEEYTGSYFPQKGTIPALTWMLFQGMFFIITPALICGAFAERMKFSTMVVFTLLWGTIVYCPLAHWVWGNGILGFVKTGGEGNGWAGGALDFAGGTVVHISSGASALICALLIGKRIGFGVEDMRPHNMTYAVIGTALLWVGWFGFNAGSQLAADNLAASAFTTTHFAAAAGGLAWGAMEFNVRGKPSVLGVCSGIVAGLVCITPGSGYVNTMPAITIGAAAGVVCFLACTWLKGRFKYDDALDAFGVHGVGGTLGALLTGVFATRAVNNTLNDGKPLGLVDGSWRLLGGQVVAILVTWIFAVAVTFVLLKILDATMGVRVSQEEEVQGLDVTQHGEEGYIFT